MKVEIKKDGILSISAENELESYAIGKWINDIKVEMPKNLLITTEILNQEK